MPAADIKQQIQQANGFVAFLRSEAAMLRANGEDLEDAEMLRAAKRLEAQARKMEQTIAQAEATVSR